jgi:4-hydroxy-tetrahydrodipicolinate synthase
VTHAFDPFSGVLAAALTPMKKDLGADHGAFARHCRWLLANGCDGLGILGTTGEANSFGLGERIEILDRLAEAGLPAAKLMPGTGACALPEAVELTRRAVADGVGGVLMLPPFYYKNVSDDGLFAYYAEVIERVGDARLRVYLYHFPQMSGVPITYELIERLLKRYPAVVRGMKDSSGVLDNMTGAAKLFPGFAVFAGADHLLLPLLKSGGAGCITACANVASGLAQEVYAKFLKGAGFEAPEGTLTAVRKAISNYPLTAALKEIMARHTGDAGWTNLRPPLVRLGKGHADALFRALDEIGLALPMAA